LEEVRAAEFRNAAGVSLEKLRQVNGDISFIANTFPSLDMPNLQEIVGTLNIADNAQLSKLSMQKLNRLGGALSVGGNKQLIHVDAFPSLQAIEGSVDCYGEFDDLEFPVLNDVRGGLNIQSSSQMFNCDGMNQMKNGVIKGTTFTCVGSVAQPKPAGLTEGGSFGGANGAKGSNKLKKVSSAPTSLPQSWFTSLSLLLFVAYYISI
jgi:hypothetical protein